MTSDKQKDEIMIFDQKYVRCTYFTQFRFQDGKRRLGMEYWLHCPDDDFKIYLIQYRISKDTSGKWLQEMINNGMVYMRSVDHALTIHNAEQLNAAISNNETKSG